MAVPFPESEADEEDPDVDANATDPAAVPVPESDSDSVDFVMTYDAVTEVGAPPPVHVVTPWQGRRIVNLLDDASVRRECAGSTREQRVRMIFEELEESGDAL